MPVPRSAPGSISRRLLRDAVFDELAGAILRGTLEPGERLRDDALEAWLGVSRTPIRQAIARLADLGVVEIAANRYTQVASPDPQRIVDCLEIAVTMWQLASRFTLPAASDVELASLIALFDEAGETCDAAEHAAAGPMQAVTAVLDAFRAPCTLAGMPVLLETVRHAEIGLAFQSRLTRDLWDLPGTRDTLSRASAAVADRDVDRYVRVCEDVLDRLAHPLVRRALQAAQPPQGRA